MSIITAGMKHTDSRLVAGFPRAGTAGPSEARKQSVTSTAGPSVPRAPGLFYLLAISIAKTSAILPILLCRGGGTGRRAGFKIRFLHGSAGSIPALGTNVREAQCLHGTLSPILFLTHRNDYLGLPHSLLPWTLKYSQAPLVEVRGLVKIGLQSRKPTRNSINA